MQKILIIRFSSIGDIVLTTPIIRCLKQQSKAEVHYVTKNPYASILESNPYVDKVFSFKNEITEILNDLKSEHYDFIVDLHTNLRSTRLKRSLGVPSAKFPKLNIQKFFLTNFKWDIMPDIHIVDRYFCAVKKLNIINDQKGLDYFIRNGEEIVLSNFNIPNKFIAFSIGAQFATKKLPNHKIIAIVNKIDIPIVLLGGRNDESNAKEIESSCPGVINLVGQLSLDGSASILKQAFKVISHDTGLMHIAAAFNKEIISIWGNTTPILGMYPYLEENKDSFSVHQLNLSCRPCSKIGYQKCPKKHFKCMEMQNVDKIVSDATEDNKTKYLQK